MRNKNQKIKTTFFCFLCLFTASCSPRSTVEGKITYSIDNKVVVGEASVYIDGKLVSKSKQLTGAFLIEEVPAGTHSLLIKKEGFNEIIKKINVPDGKPLKLNLIMDPVSQPQTQPGKNLTVINTSSKSIANIHLDTGHWSKILDFPDTPKELFLSLKKHLLYVSIPQKSQISVINLKDMLVEQEIVMEKDAKPTSIALSSNDEDQLLIVNSAMKQIDCYQFSSKQLRSQCIPPDQVSNPITLQPNSQTGHLDLLGEDAIFELSGSTVINKHALKRKYKIARLLWLNNSRQYLIHSLGRNNVYLFDPYSKEGEEKIDISDEPVKVVSTGLDSKIHILFPNYLQTYDLNTKTWGNKIETGGKEALDIIYEPSTQLFYVLDKNLGLLSYAVSGDKMQAIQLPLVKTQPNRFVLWE
ncbi:MAG: PEGA domain-containing protein [Candidatus Sericytochromatia bacterium]